METSPTPEPVKPKMNPMIRVVFGICGLIAIVVGVSQMKKGVGEMNGGKINDIESAVTEGNRLNQEAQPLFQALLDGTDKDGLEATRKRTDEAKKLTDLYAKSEAQFRTASENSAAVAKDEKDAKKQAFMSKKAEVYDLIAQSVALNREIVGDVMDPALTKMDDVVAKVTDTGKKRDELQARANAEEAEASAAMKAK